MNELRFETKDSRPPTILFLGAHCDDIEIGCGGTILRLRETVPDADIHWVVFSSTEVRKREALECARRFLGAVDPDRVRVESFRDGYLPYSGAVIKDTFEELKMQIRPDLIFTHYRQDLHQDHRLISDLTWNTWRDHTIFEYEIPKYDGDLGQPNTFVSITSEQVESKIKNVTEAYTSQAFRDWFDADTFRAIMRLRGVESNASERYAEAFYGRKMTLNF